MRLSERIAADSGIMMVNHASKELVFRSSTLQKMAGGETEADLLQAYPQLSKGDLIAVWDYAAGAAAEEIVLAES
jgi:hypothetical protein